MGFFSLSTHNFRSINPKVLGFIINPRIATIFFDFQINKNLITPSKIPRTRSLHASNSLEITGDNRSFALMTVNTYTHNSESKEQMCFGVMTEDAAGRNNADDKIKTNASLKSLSRRQQNARRVIKDRAVMQVCKLMEFRHKWDHGLERDMRYAVKKLNIHQVLKVLMYHETDPRVALQFFYWYSKNSKHPPVSGFFHCILVILSKTCMWETAERMWKELIKRNDCTVKDFNYLMMCYGRAGNLVKALGVFELMKEHGIEPDVSTYNAVMDVLVTSNLVYQPLSMFARMMQVGFAPDTQTFNVLLKCLCGFGRFDEALSVFHEMKSHDMVAYSTLLSFLSKYGRLGDVRELLRKMELDGSGPDPRCYVVLVHVLAKHGRASEALGFLNEMEEKGLRVSVVLYSAVINAFCREKNITEARRIFDGLVSKGFKPDMVTYSIVIKGYCDAGEIDEAKLMLHDMDCKGLKADTVLYTTILNGLCRLGKVKEAKMLLDSSHIDGWVPNSITYCAVMHTLWKEGRLDEAFQLVKDMFKHGCVPSNYEINRLLKSFCDKHRSYEAKALLQECLKNRYDINAMNFTTVIQGFCNEDNMEEAFSVMEDMYLNDCWPDGITYAVLIKGLGKQGNLEKVKELVLKMLESGVLPTESLYKVLMGRFKHTGEEEELQKLFEELSKSESYKEKFNLAIKTLSKNGELNKAYKLLVRVKKDSHIDTETCNLLMMGCLKKRQPMQAYKVACNMFKRNLVPTVGVCQRIIDLLVLQNNFKVVKELREMMAEKGLVQSAVHISETEKSNCSDNS